MCYLHKEMATGIMSHDSRRKTMFQNPTSKWTTPLSRKIRGKENSHHSPEAHHGADETEKLADVVLNKSLTMFQVSPLYKFSFKRKVLKALARKISLYIQKFSTTDALELDFKSKDAFSVNVIRVKGFHNDIAGILLTVTRFLDVNNDDDIDNIKEEFWGLFCRPNLDNNPNYSNALTENFVKLPLLFVKGNASLTKTIISFFTQQYDCSIRKFVFNPLELAWLGAMWAGYVVDTPQKPLLLKYRAPGNITGLNKITLLIEPRNVVQLWKSTHNETADEFLLEELKAFTMSLKMHFEVFFKVNLSAFSLTEVNSTSLQVQAAGKVKILSRRTSPRILAHFESLAEGLMSF